MLNLIPCCRYMMIAPTIQQARCKTWIQRHLPRDCSVSVSDVTSMFTAIAIIGPFTRTLLSELTDTDLSPKSFPFFTYKVGVSNVKKLFNFAYTVFAKLFCLVVCDPFSCWLLRIFVLNPTHSFLANLQKGCDKKKPCHSFIII